MSFAVRNKRRGGEAMFWVWGSGMNKRKGKGRGVGVGGEKKGMWLYKGLERGYGNKMMKSRMSDGDEADGDEGKRVRGASREVR